MPWWHRSCSRNVYLQLIYRLHFFVCTMHRDKIEKRQFFPTTWAYIGLALSRDSKCHVEMLLEGGGKYVMLPDVTGLLAAPSLT